MEIEFPIEFVVSGTPVSLQAKRAASKNQWKERVRNASSEVLPEAHFASEERLSVTILHFPDGQMQGDIDNIVKPILDALSQYIYIDDRQVDRVLVQKFEVGRVFEFEEPTTKFASAIGGMRPLTYIRVSDNPFEELR